MAARLGNNGAIQHFSRALQRGLGHGRAIEHRGQFSLPRVFIEGLDGRYDAAIALALGDMEMDIPERRDLRQMGYDYHLVIFRQGPEGFADDLTGSPTHANVDLVEDERGRPVRLGEDRLQRQHQPGRLTAGRNLAQG